MSPILDHELEKYRHILMFDDERVMDSVIALRDNEGHDWWHLVVDLGPDGYAAAPFSDLSQFVKDQEASALEAPLSSLVGSVLVKVDSVVEQDSVSMAEALDLAQNAAGRITVVVHEGEFHSILVISTRKGMFESSLLNLAGQVAEIPKTGIISKRRLKQLSNKKKSPSGSEAKTDG
jgi:hypothetical protein